MANVVINPIAEISDSLKKFLGCNSIASIDRTSYLIWPYTDKLNKVDLSIVFVRDCHNMDYTDFRQVGIETKGAVFIVPGYWLGVQKDLSYNYLKYIIDDYYRENNLLTSSDLGSGLITGGSGGSTTGSTGSGNNNCNSNCCRNI